MTAQCRDQLTEQLLRSVRKGHEGIVYFIGLTTGCTTLALSASAPEVAATPGSVDVSAAELGKVIRFANMSELQVVGQLHTHPGGAYHSDGDLAGMRIRYPGYCSIVVPKLRYSAPVVPRFPHPNVDPQGLPGGRAADHILRWTRNMNQQEYRQRLLDRESRYPGQRPLPDDIPVHIRVDPEYSATYAGQVAAITAASLFGRMSNMVTVAVEPQSVHPSLPWAGATLDKVVMQTLKEADPYGCYERGPAQAGDFPLVIGLTGDGLVVHGSGWGRVLRHGSVSALSVGRTESVLGRHSP